jgi:hypothetical protein
MKVTFDRDTASLNSLNSIIKTNSHFFSKKYNVATAQPRAHSKVTHEMIGLLLLLLLLCYCNNFSVSKEELRLLHDFSFRKMRDVNNWKMIYYVFLPFHDFSY